MVQEAGARERQGFLLTVPTWGYHSTSLCPLVCIYNVQILSAALLLPEGVQTPEGRLHSTSSVVTSIKYMDILVVSGL